MSVFNEDDIEYLAVHCTATEEGIHVTAEDIDRWHKQRNWREIGYHFVIHLDGRIEFGRDLDESGAHVKGFNSKSRSVVYVGGLRNGRPADTRTPEQKESLKIIYRFMKKVSPKIIIQGHRDFPNVHKDCPCFDVRHELHPDLR